MKKLEEIGSFLKENIEKYNGDDMFSVIFPIVYLKSNEENIDYVFNAFLNWWNNNVEFRLTSDDIQIALKFNEYFKERKRFNDISFYKFSYN